MVLHQDIRLLQNITVVGVFIFLSGLFVLPSSYSWAAVILLFASIWMLGSTARNTLVLRREDRVLLYTLAAYGVVMITMTVCLGNRLREIDNPARALLVIPIVLLLLRVPVQQTVLWGGVIVGAVLSAILSCWEVLVLHLPRAAGYHNRIHFGGYALIFSAFCAAGLIWAKTQGRYAGKWRVALIVGILSGLCSMMLSGSRGAWISLPVVLLVLLLASAQRLRRRHYGYIALCVAGGIAIVIALFAQPDSVLYQRYVATVSDITQYQQHNADTSIGARFEMWRAGAMAVAQRPILVWGKTDYQQWLETLTQQGLVDRVVLQFKENLHNAYIHTWVFFGLPGLLALLTLFAVPLRYFVRRVRDADPTVSAMALCGTVLIVSYACMSLTQVLMAHNGGMMFFLLTLAIVWGAQRHAMSTAVRSASVDAKTA